ncbi:flavin reductase family protein [Sandarakinorhabdus sp. DWP1-3-1]|uniref:flavin reductase family protein n=1 Tax=Sandarakinorhabdus sp. DWP1-3-1 TaxID=2804627 RepID=UPI003CF23401
MTETTLQRAIGVRPVGVAIVACNGAAGPEGVLVGTLASLSADPPRVSFAIARTARPLAALRAAPALSIQLLAPDQVEVAVQFSDSARTAERFASADWRITTDRPPQLNGVAACLFGVAWQIFDTQTHALFVVDVTGAWRFGEASLLYKDGKFLPGDGTA